MIIGRVLSGIYKQTLILFAVSLLSHTANASEFSNDSSSVKTELAYTVMMADTEAGEMQLFGNGFEDPEVQIPKVYAIGAVGPAGGTVFHITEGGYHGLEVALGFYPSVEWGCEDIDLPLAADTSIGSGKSNTEAILATCSTTGIAASVANTFELNGFADWFLPSQDEAVLFGNLMDSSGSFLVAAGWTSTALEGQPGIYHGQNLAVMVATSPSGGQFDYVYLPRDQSRPVHPVREF